MDSGTSVEHMGAGRDLGQGVGLDRGVVAGRHLGGQALAAGRIDTLADDAERAVEADRHLFAVRADACLSHGRGPLVSFLKLSRGLDSAGRWH
jgi:hypothetical protein